MQQIYNEYGVEIIKKGNRFFMRYDSGEIVIQILEIEITQEEAEQICNTKDSNELYNQMIQILNK